MWIPPQDNGAYIFGSAGKFQRVGATGDPSGSYIYNCPFLIGRLRGRTQVARFKGEITETKTIKCILQSESGRSIGMYVPAWRRMTSPLYAARSKEKDRVRERERAEIYYIVRAVRRRLGAKRWKLAPTRQQNCAGQSAARTGRRATLSVRPSVDHRVTGRHYRGGKIPFQIDDISV